VFEKYEEAVNGQRYVDYFGCDHGRPQNLSRGVKTHGLVKGLKDYLSNVYLWNTNTCCRISLCRKEFEGVSVSDSVHGLCSAKIEKQNPGGASAPPCTCLRAPLVVMGTRIDTQSFSEEVGIGSSSHSLLGRNSNR